MGSRPPEPPPFPPEEELRLQRERLELALTASDTCTWEADFVKNVLRLDARWSAMIGAEFRPTESIYHGLLRHAHPDDRAESVRAFRACYEGGDGIYRREQRVITQRGDCIWVLSVGRVVARDARGRALRILGTNTDITRLKKAEANLQEANARLERTVHERSHALAEVDLRLRTLFDHAAIGVVEADVNGRLIRANAHYCALLGYTEEELRARTVSEISHPDDMPANRILMDALIRGERREFSLEKRYIRKDGRHVWTELKVAALWAPGSPPDGVVAMVQDITARRQAEEAMREASLAQSHAMPGISRVDPNGNFESVNEAYAGMMGTTPAALLGRPFGPTVHPVDLPIAHAAWEKLKREGTAEFEVRGVRADGSIFDKRVLLVRRSGPTGEFVGHHCFMRDISDRKANEMALRENEEKFRSVFDRSPVIICLLTVPDGRLVEVNEAAVAAFGYTREEAIGRTTLELEVWADVAERNRYLEELAARGAVQGFEARMRRKDGIIFTALYSGSIVSIGGRPFSLNLLQDISARKEAERARDELLALTMSTIESTTDGILVVDAHGRFQTFNRLFCQMWRVPDEIITARDDERAIAWAIEQLTSPEQFREKVQALYNAPLAESFDTLQFKDGRVFERFSRPQIVNGKPAGRVWSFRDVTERVRAERERATLEDSLRQAQKMESLGTLAGGIAHDFNNILAGMFGSIELARMGLSPSHPSLKWINQAMASAQRARSLVRQILAFGRQGETERIPAALGAVVSEALSLLRSTIPPGVKLEPRLDPTCAPVLADPTQIHQVVVNLCTNAWHALPDRGGRIVVSLTPCLIGEEQTRFHPQLQPGPGVRLSVTDNGHGMDAATIARIYDPFFTTKEPGRGTGLGLAVVHGIVSTHGAAITVSSKLGEGTTFALFFPAIAAPALPPETPAPEHQMGQGEHILLVDDDEAGAEATAQMLRTLGYRVTNCTQPAIAFETFQHAPDDFDLVCTDLAMPEINGDQLVLLLQKIRPELPVVIISGLTEPSRSNVVNHRGARETLLKPLTFQELAAAMARNLGKPGEYPHAQ